VFLVFSNLSCCFLPINGAVENQESLYSQLLLVGKDRNIYLTNTDLHVIRISDLLTPVCTKLVLSNCRMSKSFWMFFSSKSSQKSLSLVCNMFFPKVTEEELWGLRVSLLLRPLDKTQIVIWSEPFLLFGLLYVPMWRQYQSLWTPSSSCSEPCQSRRRFLIFRLHRCSGWSSDRICRDNSYLLSV